MPVYLEQLGADELAVGLTVTLVTAAALLVRPFAGLILDSFGRKGALITGIILMLFVIVAYLLFPLVGVVLALRIFHGKVGGCRQPRLRPLLRMLFLKFVLLKGWVGTH